MAPQPLQQLMNNSLRKLKNPRERTVSRKPRRAMYSAWYAGCWHLVGAVFLEWQYAAPVDLRPEPPHPSVRPTPPHPRLAPPCPAPPTYTFIWPDSETSQLHGSPRQSCHQRNESRYGPPHGFARGNFNRLLYFQASSSSSGEVAAAA